MLIVTDQTEQKTTCAYYSNSRSKRKFFLPPNFVFSCLIQDYTKQKENTRYILRNVETN